jgi:DNA-binding cell septation regulator SpoVG
MMHISIEHHEGKYPSFNIALSSAEGKEPFLVVKGCRVVDGNNGRFVSTPARKLDSGKYWNHVYLSEQFSVAVLAAYDKSKPKKAKQSSIEDQNAPF